VFLLPAEIAYAAFILGDERRAGKMRVFIRLDGDGKVVFGHNGRLKCVHLFWRT
jgi:hypothetical protein